MEAFNTNIFPKGEKAPSAYFSGGTAHIAINPNTQHGIVEWLEPVTDEEYNNL